jgi:uncharacterized lipoprotein
MKTHRLALLSAVVLGFPACGTSPVPVNYAPSSTMSNIGSTGVAPFSYAPAEPGSPHPVAADQIRNTAMGDVHIDREVRVFVRDAVFTELRLTGIKTDDRTRLLNGQIQEFLMDDLGYSVDWTLRIKYWLTDATTHKVVFASVKETRRKTAKFVNVFGALNETIKLNAEALMEDPAFKTAINVQALPPEAPAPAVVHPEPVQTVPVQPAS